MTTMADRVVVAFTGEGDGVAGLSWGQQDIWQAMVRQKSWLPNGAWGPLPEGTTVDDVAEQLRYMMSRFPTARTRLRFDEDGRPSQVVAASGEITLDIVDSGPQDPAAVAESERLRLQDAEYDFAEDWPVRMAAIRSGGVLTHLVVVMCHLVADGFGTGVMLEDLATRVETPIPQLQPLEQARWQASPSGQRQNTLALRHWDGILRGMAPRRFPDTAEKPEPRHWRGEFTSHALAPALRAVTERTGVASAPALLAVFAVALARVTKVNPVVLRPMVNNRFRPGLDRVVCMLAQYGLCQLDVAGVSFAEVLDRARRGALTTYKHAYYHPVELDDLIRRVVEERGADLELPCYFNDRRTDTASAPAERDELQDLVSRAVFEWTTRQDVPFEPLIVHIDDLPDDTVRAIIFMDTHVVSPADGEALLRGMEAVAVEAALDPDAPTGV
ncbi:condensation domain-containing protein [Dactylosporangium sp. NPDC005555]|uniref:condensation domain-containing protein n=1 Tax=Dactylosporangium sp. NPDC005555 TaxID=3154889 RepID=UPI0033A80EE5